ncbi:MAG: hypothetical protein GY947_07375 [Rhodobacteraceae bacterium]|nr:hypothetical protein [Paracoccaceae bacterium]
MTSRGDIPVQHLTSGDRVLTRDSGMQLVRWVGKTVQNVKPGLGPVFFSKGTINNSRDLSICPNQCVVLKGAEPMAAFGDPEVLVPAYKFINEHKVIRSAPPNVTYYRILTNRHELVYAEAAAIESFRPSRENVALLGQQQQSEIQLVFPDILEPGFDYGPPARRDITTPTQ